MRSKEQKIIQLYESLFSLYGPQGWWPTVKKGYHPNDYDFPTNHDEIFEVCVGSILTQNTTWTSVEKSLKNLDTLHALNPDNFLKLKKEDLIEAITPSGFKNQKAIYLQIFTQFFLDLKGKIPTRDQLLALKGIGEETADSILLFGFNQPSFKVDAYTKRIFHTNDITPEKIKYIEIKTLIEDSFHKHFKCKSEIIKAYQEFHALLVTLGKTKNYNIL